MKYLNKQPNYLIMKQKTYKNYYKLIDKLHLKNNNNNIIMKLLSQILI